MIRMEASQLAARLVMDNPWWGTSLLEAEQAVPGESRLFFGLFRKAVADSAPGRARLLMGPRRAGKSIMVRQLIQTLLREGVPAKRIFYFPLKAPVYFGSTLKELIARALEGRIFDAFAEQYIFFDDIQYIKGWEQELQGIARAYPKTRITGVTSLAPQPDLKGKGRNFSEFMLPPITFAEYMHFTQNDDLFDPPDRELPGGAYPTTRNILAVNRHFMNYIKAGGYPEAVFSWEMRRDPLRFAKSDILDNVLLSDVPNLYGIGEIKELNRFFCSLALANGRETSQDRLRKDSGLAKNTMRRYLEYLEASFLMYRLRRVDENNKEFVRERSLKLYLANPCLYSALFAPGADEQPYQDDSVMEQLVRATVLCQYRHGAESGQLRYARWNGGEVDCMLFPYGRARHTGHYSHPAWIAAMPWVDEPAERPEMLRGLAEYCNRHKHRGSVLCLTRTQSGYWQGPDGLELELVPAALFCHGVSQRLHSS